MGIGKLIAQKINIKPSNYAEKVNTQSGYKGKGFGANGLYLEAGFLLNHRIGSMPHKSEVDVLLSYADYYF